MASITQKSKLTGKEITTSERLIPRTEYAQDNAYYAGRNVKILTQADKKAPDNRVPVAFVNRLIKNLTGYAARAGDISTDLTPLKGDTPESIKKAFEVIESENYINILNSKLYKETLKHGIAFGLTWVTTKDGESEIHTADVPIGEALPIWDQSLSTVKKLSKFIRYYERSESSDIVIENQSISLVPGKYANVYLKGGYEIWLVRKAGETKSDEDSAAVFIAFIDQPFTDIQVVCYQANDELIPYWLPVKNIIDEYDKIISGNINESDRFNDTWLLMWQKLSPEVKKSIDEMGVMDNLQAAARDGFNDVYPKFLERNIPVDHAKLMLETLETLLYTLIGVPSFLDESFNGASGVSLLFRLIGLEYAAIEIDTYFDLALKERFKLYKQALGSGLVFKGIDKVNESDLDNISSTIKHKRNLPADISTILDQAIKLKALGLSDELILKHLPRDIVPIVSEELKKIEAKKALETELINKTLNGPEDKE